MEVDICVKGTHRQPPPSPPPPCFPSVGNSEYAPVGTQRERGRRGKGKFLRMMPCSERLRVRKRGENEAEK